MSTSEKTQDGDTVHVQVRTLKQFFEKSVPKPEALQKGLLYKDNIHWFVGELDSRVRMMGLLLACTVAAGADFGPFAKGPGQKVMYVSGAGDEAADHHRLAQIVNSFPAEQQAKLNRSFSIYSRDSEGDDLIDLTTNEGRGIFDRSIPTDIQAVFIDCLPAFADTESISARKRDELDIWFRGLTGRGLTVVIFDVETKNRTMREERRAKNTIYLDYDSTAPTQFGGGCLLRRNRIDDADSMPKCVSFWYTEFDGQLEYGFSVPDDEDLDAPRLTKRLERQIKVERMLLAGMSQKTIAEKLQVNAATICRDSKEIEIRAAKDAKAKAKSSSQQLDAGSKVGDK